MYKMGSERGGVGEVSTKCKEYSITFLIPPIRKSLVFNSKRIREYSMSLNLLLNCSVRPLLIIIIITMLFFYIDKQTCRCVFII